MSRIQMARLLIRQRLSAAAEDIFRIFEGMIIEYEEQIHHQMIMLDASTDKHPTEHLQLPVCEEEISPEQQQRNPIMVLVEEPGPPPIKEEQEEQFGHQEEADSIKLTLTLEKHESYSEIPVSPQLQAVRKEEKPATLLSTSTEQIKSQPNGGNYGVSGPASVLYPATYLEPGADGLLLNLEGIWTNTADNTCSLNENTPPHLGSHTLNPGQTKEGQTWSTRNHFQSPAEMSHPLESSDHIQSSHYCKVCLKSFHNRRCLIHHIKAHPRDCGLCGKRLDSRETLTVHLSAHKKCSVCGRAFVTFTRLKRHLRTHTGERPFCCTVCGKGFSQKGNLKKHMVSHTGVKPFDCLLCGKVFSKEESLQKHLRIHTG